jgi:hypothetical protein
MAQVVAGLVASASAGCLLPTQLDSAPPDVNHRPVLVTSQVQPSFGPLEHAATDTVEIQVVAEDPDLGDDLTARLFHLNAQGTLDFIAELQHLTQDPKPNDLVRRGAFTPFKLCSVLVPGDLFLVVADRPFTSTTAEAQGGLTDENHWELTCVK